MTNDEALASVIAVYMREIVSSRYERKQLGIDRKGVDMWSRVLHDEGTPARIVRLCTKHGISLADYDRSDTQEPRPQEAARAILRKITHVGSAE